MTISPILGDGLLSRQPISTRLQQFKQNFEQLGQDIQGGNLEAARSDLSAMAGLLRQQHLPASTDNALVHSLRQLQQDLEAGDVSAAQQDYAKLEKDVNQWAARIRHNSFLGGEGPGTVHQLFQQLGKAIESGDLASARQIFGALKHHLEALPEAPAKPTPQANGSNISVSA
jgi:hypothetical protein